MNRLVSKKNIKKDKNKKKTKWCVCVDPIFHPFAPYCLRCGKLIKFPYDSYF